MANEMKAFDYSSTPVAAQVRQLLGAGLSTNLLQALIARGFGWHADVGAFSTGIAGGGNGLVLDLDQPEFGISIPTGYTCIPIRLHAQGQVPLLATDADEAEILFAVDRTAKWAGDGTVTTEVPTNMRTDITASCPLTVVSACTADLTDPVLGIELARAVLTGDSQTAVGTTWAKLDLLYEPTLPPLIVGPAAIWGYWGGTVVVPGFANLDFIAIPSALLTGLV